MRAAQRSPLLKFAVNRAVFTLRVGKKGRWKYFPSARRHASQLTGSIQPTVTLWFHKLSEPTGSDDNWQIK